MATSVKLSCCFCSKHVILFLVLYMTVPKRIYGKHIHLMSVTPTPYGAFVINSPQGTLPPSVVCLLSPPDTNLLSTIVTGRHVLGSGALFNTLTLPSTSSTQTNNVDISVTTLALAPESEGVYYCQASNNYQTTRVPVTIVGILSWLTSPLAEFTITRNIGDHVAFTPKINFTPGEKNSVMDILWEKLADEIDENTILSYAGPSYQIGNVTMDNAGVYYAYWRDWGHTPNGFLYRLIVRGCSQSRWSPPLCNGVCDNCYNGGICDDATGVCVCRPGFTGPNCLIACTVNTFGWNCEHQCGISLGVTSCIGSVFCMPDPVGCSCMSGWMGEKCDQVCPQGMYGAGCTEFCHCQSGSCDRFTGRCDGSCSFNWSGENCQIPQMCLHGYYGNNCTMICHCSNCDNMNGCKYVICDIGYWGDSCENECHCHNNGVCDRQTGKCFTDIMSGGDVCEPGYVSSTGTNVDNCQRLTSCFSECTKTCHCFSNEPCNIMTGQCSNGCLFNWVGDSCQIGIIEATSIKTNPGQPIIATCTITGESMLSGDQVTFLSSQNTPIGERIDVQPYGQFLSVTQKITTITDQNGVFRCTFASTSAGRVAFALIVANFYSLPVLTSDLLVNPESITPNGLVLQWDAWDPTNGRDTGDGPLIGYNIYDSNTLIAAAPVSFEMSITWQIVGLTPDRHYLFNVRPVREGPGGEGTSSSSVDVTTLPEPSTPSSAPIDTVTIQQPLELSPQMANSSNTVKPDPSAAVPGQPTDIRVKSITTTSVTLTWTSSNDSYGRILHHRVDYRAIYTLPGNNEILKGTFFNATTKINKNADGIFVFVLSNLIQATSYEIFISAENAGGVGEQASIVITTKSHGSTNENAGLIAGGTSGAAILITILLVVVIIVRKRFQTNDSDKEEGTRFENQAFSRDLGEYEDVDIDDKEYEDITSNRWDIAWEDIQLTGDLLGKGNFGDVQLGRVKIRDKWIMAAVKTLKQGSPEMERTLFKEEFDTMTRIGYHPNVVNIIGSCEHDGSFFVILEYIHHGNLRKFLRTCRKQQNQSKTKGPAAMIVTPDQLFNFAMGVAKAMKHIADCGVIHRDLAARNVLVGRGYVPKVADFGMSKEEDEYVQTSSRRVPTRWLSIESITKRMYSTKSDVWSFGILLWEIATFGGTPYPDMETKQLSSKLTSGYRMPKPDNCQDDMYQLMLQCWQEDPNTRPSFKDIVDTLNAMVSKEEIYMSTHFYSNFKYAVICPEKDDK